MKRIYLTHDNRNAVTYKNYIGKTVKNLKQGQVIIKTLCLYDPTVMKYRKETVNIHVTGVDKRFITVEVI